MSETGDKPKGRPWPKGMSGNPGGRAKGIEREIRDKYGKDALAIVAVQVNLALGRNVPGYEDAKAADRVKAGISALERIAGKVPQAIEGSMDLGASPEHLALLAALRMTPHERRTFLAQVDEEDAAALAQDTTNESVDADGYPAE